jgi:hypothetical protein
MEHEALSIVFKDWDLRTKDAVKLYWGGKVLRDSKLYLAAVVVDHPQLDKFAGSGNLLLYNRPQCVIIYINGQVDVIVVTVQLNLSWILIKFSSQRQRPGSERQFRLLLMEFQGQAGRLWSSAPMAQSTPRALMLVTMIGSINARDFTFSSTHFGLFQIFVCFKCTCVIRCTKSTMVLSFMYCEEFCASSMVIISINM